MNRKTRNLIIVLAPLVLYAVIAVGMLFSHLMSTQATAGSTGSGENTQAPTGPVEFVFTGTVETATGRTFTLNMTGNQDAEQTLSLAVKEMPALNLTGH